MGGGYRTNPSTPSQRVSSSECRGNRFLEQEPFETYVTGGGGGVVGGVGGGGGGVGGGGGDGGGGGGRVAAVTASCLSPNVNGAGRKGSNRRESGVATGGGILDLEAVTEAAGRLNGTGGHSPSLVNRVPHNPRNRFAPMAESEVARFLQQGNDRYLSSAAGNGAGGGHEIIGLNENHVTTAAAAAAAPAPAAATAGGAGTGIGRRLLVVGESTGRDGDGARTVLVSASEDARLFRPSSTPLDGWQTNQTSTTGNERRERS